jgi:hypothetical protein
MGQTSQPDSLHPPPAPRPRPRDMGVLTSTLPTVRATAARAMHVTVSSGCRHAHEMSQGPKVCDFETCFVGPVARRVHISSRLRSRGESAFLGAGANPRHGHRRIRLHIPSHVSARGILVPPGAAGVWAHPPT